MVPADGGHADHARPPPGPTARRARRPAQPPATLRLVSGAAGSTVVQITNPLTSLGRELDNDW